MPEENSTDTPSNDDTPMAHQKLTTDETVTTDAPSPTMPPLTGERVIDMALGAIAIAADATVKRAQQLSEQAKTIREDAPAILEGFEERGRPLREQLMGKIREGFAPIPDEGDDASQPGGRTAEQDIHALEQRVRELEAEVSTTPETEAIVPPVVDEETPAEEATFVPNDDEPFALADSEYAVSETDEEVEREHDASPPPKSEGENPGDFAA